MSNKFNDLQDEKYSERYIINSLINYYGEVKDAIDEHKEIKKNLEEIILDYFRVCEINEKPIDSIETHHIRAERIPKEVDHKITDDDIKIAANLNVFDIRRTYPVSEYFLKKAPSENKKEIDIYDTYIRYINDKKEEDKIKLVEYVIKNNKLWILERCSENNMKIRYLGCGLKITKL